MLVMGAALIAEHSTALLNNGKGMPEMFPATFTAAKTNFDTVLQEYMSIRKTVKRDTGAKTAANNAVYATLMDMLQDGKIVFEDNPEIKKLFT